MGELEKRKKLNSIRLAVEKDTSNPFYFTKSHLENTDEDTDLAFMLSH